MADLLVLELDSAFKRLRYREKIELVFATMLQQHGKNKNLIGLYAVYNALLTSLVFTIARIFMNHETKEGYKRAFIRFFQLIKIKLGRPNRWNTIPINGSGWSAISINIDSKIY
jgi:hypothetical protein